MTQEMDQTAGQKAGQSGTQSRAPDEGAKSNTQRSAPSGPVLIEVDDRDPELTPATAQVVPDLGASGAVMQSVVAVAARAPSRLARWFWGSLATLFGFILSVAAWDFVTGLLLRNVYLGYVALGLTAVFLGVLLVIALREWLSFARMRKVDGIHANAQSALASHDLATAHKVSGQIDNLYGGRADLQWARARFDDLKAQQLDADGLLALIEIEILAPLDLQATKEVEAAARQVATVTAIVPLALADVAVALTANIRMIRKIAQVYGGRSGALGSWRLLRTVVAHLVATGAVAVGDDLISSIAGGGLLSKLSRRFGEGVVNGALTARVGVAAMEVCRPLPFVRQKRPSVTGVVQRALAGLFSRDT